MKCGLNLSIETLIIIIVAVAALIIILFFVNMSREQGTSGIKDILNVTKWFEILTKGNANR
ncbi:MAG: hypothetical protein QXT34_02640 [Candidatus Aenigmatarchaeota archaeon]